MNIITFYAYQFEHSSVLHGWVETVREINSNSPYIFTTQMGLLSTKLFELGYRIFVANSKDENPFEIRLGSNDCTDREVRMGHNLFKMWQNGEFQ